MAIRLRQRDKPHALRSYGKHLHKAQALHHCHSAQEITLRRRDSGLCLSLETEFKISGHSAPKMLVCTPLGMTCGSALLLATVRLPTADVQRWYLASRDDTYNQLASSQHSSRSMRLSLMSSALSLASAQTRSWTLFALLFISISPKQTLDSLLCVHDNSICASMTTRLPWAYTMYLIKFGPVEFTPNPGVMVPKLDYTSESSGRV